MVRGDGPRGSVPVVALATCLEIPEPDVDEDLLVRALAEEGIEPRVVAWDGDPRELEGVDRIVLRSTWNYHLEIDRFLPWVDAQATRIDNRPRVVRWNAHKSYLLDLAREGFAIVPTAWFKKDENLDLAALAASRGFQDVVVKPAVSAGSYSTRRFEKASEGQEFARALALRGDVMVQPYLDSVDGHGERSIVCVDGKVTHAIRKSPRFSGQSESVSRVEVGDDERALAEALLRRFSETLLYARVDVMRGRGGEALVSEVELIEPSLFLLQAPEALTRFAKAIARRTLRS